MANEENRIGYYSIIPSTVLFNEQLKANEKLLYAVITVLSNKEGYCFASNFYLAGKLNAKPHTISKWVSHLRELGFVCVDIIKNDKGEIIQRKIYPNDTPYSINRTYPYTINGTEGMSQKGQYNNISINNINNDKIDRLFNYVMDSKSEVPDEFKDVVYDEIITALRRYEILYSKDNLEFITEDNLNKIKQITYVISLVVKNKLFYLNNKVSRDKLISIYNECKNKAKEYEGTDNQIEDFSKYYYKSVVNELTKEVQPSFFVPENDEIEL